MIAARPRNVDRQHYPRVYLEELIAGRRFIDEQLRRYTRIAISRSNMQGSTATIPSFFDQCRANLFDPEKPAGSRRIVREIASNGTENVPHARSLPGHPYLRDWPGTRGIWALSLPVLCWRELYRMSFGYLLDSELHNLHKTKQLPFPLLTVLQCGPPRALLEKCRMYSMVAPHYFLSHEAI